MKIRQPQGAFLSQNYHFQNTFPAEKVTAFHSNEERYLKGFGGWQGGFHRACSANVKVKMFQSSRIPKLPLCVFPVVTSHNGHPSVSFIFPGSPSPGLPSWDH